MDTAGEAAIVENNKTWKGETGARREVLALMADIEDRVTAVAATLSGASVRVRRAPGRCVVQAGRFGLGVSWLQPEANTVAGGTLLVLEWDGPVTLHGEPPPLSRRAKLLREHALHLFEDGATWRWRRDDARQDISTSSELARWCVQLLMRRLEESAPASASPPSH